ncbi:MAG: hypothetical protein Q4C01_04570 [Clostridia bacterium]|nr:hypothetical protein [Clostridia bacterium]
MAKTRRNWGKLWVALAIMLGLVVLAWPCYMVWQKYDVGAFKNSVAAHFGSCTLTEPLLATHNGVVTEINPENFATLRYYLGEQVGTQRIWAGYDKDLDTIVLESPDGATMTVYEQENPNEGVIHITEGGKGGYYIVETSGYWQNLSMVISEQGWAQKPNTLVEP